MNEPEIIESEWVVISAEEREKMISDRSVMAAPPAEFRFQIEGFCLMRTEHFSDWKKFWKSISSKENE